MTFKFKKQIKHQFIEVDNWRNNLVESVFKFVSIFGLFAYIPSIYISVKNGLIDVIVLDSIFYFSFVIFHFLKFIPPLVKRIYGASIFWVLGVFLLLALGPRGAGNVWLFSSIIFSAFLVGELGSIITLILTTIVYVVIFFLIKFSVIDWNSIFQITSEVWFIKCINYTLLNTVVVIINSAYLRGFKSILEKMRESRDATIYGLAKLAEFRDSETGEHLQNIRELTKKIALNLRENKKYRAYISDFYIDDLEISSMLHDIGKVGVRDSILLKKGALTVEEFEAIKTHPVFGGATINEIEKKINGQSFYTLGKEIVLYHHERWDGKGYPVGLKGQHIPLSARIVSLADVYDALTSKRPYKEAFSHEKSIEIIKEWSGTHFDPEIVEAFLKIFQ